MASRGDQQTPALTSDPKARGGQPDAKPRPRDRLMLLLQPDQSTRYRVTVSTAEEALEDPEIHRRWRELVQHIHPLNRGFASPEWLRLRVHSCPGTQKRVAVVTDSLGDIVGICPLETHHSYFNFSVGRRSLLRPRVLAACVLGDEPMIPSDSRLHRQLYRGILDHWPEVDCVLVTLPWEADVCHSLRTAGRGEREFVHVEGGGPSFRFAAPLEGDFERYTMTVLSQKGRRNIRKETRDLRAAFNDQVRLIRVEGEDQADAFLSRARPLYEKTWQFRDLGWMPNALNAADVHAFARAGILRSYLLECGGEACAFMLGIQCEGVYYFMLTGYEGSYAERKLVPGKVMIHMAVEDFYKFNKPDYFDFGGGDNFYKHFFGCVSHPGAHMMIFRDRWRHRFLCRSHQSFYQGLRLAKRLVRRERSRAAAPSD
jgi:CelD/BcsL family acetyltransferase involved in cellulose biosynthesis